MDGWITNLAGIFDGFTFSPGPLHVEVRDGKIETIQDTSPASSLIDATNLILSPGFVDGHTHLIFAGSRYNELSLKLSGYSYSDILAQGGGIQSTVAATRAAPSKDLTTAVTRRLDVMLSHGSLIVEAKSGYGLSVEHELRLLEVLKDVNSSHPVDLISTFGAAHVPPPDIPRDMYIEQIMDDMLPKVISNGLASSTDVFCDKGAFTVDETCQIFDRADRLGHRVKVHAEELEYTGIAQIASQNYSLLSADHLLLATKDDFEELARNSAVAMFMPLAPFGLFTDNVPKGFVESSVTLGLGSDFNPNNWAVSMQTALRMAVFRYRLTPLQAFRAATSGSYLGIIGQKQEILQKGSSASFLLLRARTLEEFTSKFGQNLVSHVIKDGKIVRENSHPTV